MATEGIGPAWTSGGEMERSLEEFCQNYRAVVEEISKVVYGQDVVVEEMLTCLLAGGHALVEGVPGLGKTLLATTLSQVLNLSYRRIQFTPDLMPADITGTSMIEPYPDRLQFRFERGPIFGNLLLADEINRATPKTQAALLEAMEERQVTVAGTTYSLPRPFVVLGTQNPIEMEGTYPLPEAQIDRFFFKIKITMPSDTDLIAILRETTRGSRARAAAVLETSDVVQMQALVAGVPVAKEILERVARLLEAFDPRGDGAHPIARESLQRGCGIRAGQALIRAAKVRAVVEGRCWVSDRDLLWSAPAALRHRLRLTVGAEMDGREVDEVSKAIAGEVLLS